MKEQVTLTHWSALKETTMSIWLNKYIITSPVVIEGYQRVQYRNVSGRSLWKLRLSLRPEGRICSHVLTSDPLCPRCPSVCPGVLLRCFSGPPGQEDAGDLRVGLRPGHEQRLHRSGGGVTTETGEGVWFRRRTTTGCWF